MTKSKLIELWYTEFCIKNLKPRPDFKTFCQMMKQNNWDYKVTMKEYNKKIYKGYL